MVIQSCLISCHSNQNYNNVDLKRMKRYPLVLRFLSFKGFIPPLTSVDFICCFFLFLFFLVKCRRGTVARGLLGTHPYFFPNEELQHKGLSHHISLSQVGCRVWNTESDKLLCQAIPTPSKRKSQLKVGWKGISSFFMIIHDFSFKQNIPVFLWTKAILGFGSWFIN